jgi:AAA+ superfamily predicted ATPase
MMAMGAAPARSRMLKLFTDAHRLGAILLLDEADVVLEERSFEDVKRNGLVSGEAETCPSTSLEVTD